MTVIADTNADPRPDETPDDTTAPVPESPEVAAAAAAALEAPNLPAVRQQQSLPAKIQYCELLADSGLLPAQYRNQPANVLWALEYGEMLRLAPMAAMTGVHVIEGKPSASAGLISALVRRAGHKLRVFGDSKSATCQIVRCDDPGFTFQVTWTLRKNADDNPSAEMAKLLGKDVWIKYPAAMLKSRAITQCARDACEEALFGLHYTPEELGAEVDGDGNVVGGEIVEEAAWSSSRQQPASAPVDAEVIEEDPAWVDAMKEHAACFGTEEAGQALWRQTAAKRNAREITAETALAIAELLKARAADLAAAAQEAPAPLDPEDPWAPKVECVECHADADAAIAELEAEFAAGNIDETRAGQIRAAILARVADTAEAVA
jgi:hypothetical protein